MAIRPRWTSVYMGCWVLSTALMLIGCDPGSSTPPLGPADEPTTLAEDALSLGRGGVRGGGGGRWPKTITSISVSPDTTLISPSRQQAFKAQGRTIKGNLVSLEVDWSATGGSIDSTGTYKAGTRSGRFYVKGRTSDGLADSAVVDIAPAVDTAAIRTVVLTPALDTVATQGTVTFAATGRLTDGSSAPVAVTYSAAGGTISAAGLYQAGSQTGRYRVIATDPALGLADTAVVVIVTPVVDTVETTAVVLTPALDTLAPQATVTFAAIGKLSDGSSAPVDVTYSASGGTISAAGVYKAGSQAGRYRVVASADALGLADTAVVVIAAPTLSRLTLTPASASLLAGGKQQFAVAGLLSDGTSAPVSATYTAQGGTIDGSGLYTAGGTAGTYRVIATAGGLADTATVTISVPSGNGEPAALADDFVNTMSVQTHLGYTGGVYDTKWSTIIRPRLLELGIRHIRERMVTSSVVVQRTRDLGANGIALTAGCWPKNGVMTDASHCIAMANAYGTQTIDAFDGWNEVDNTGTGWATNWAKWQATMYDTYKADPTWRTRPVLANSLAAASSADAVGYQAGLMQWGNMHSYPAGGLPSNVSNSWIPQWRKIAGTKPLAVTETGYHNCPTCFGNGVSERASGKYYSRLWFEYFNRGVVRTNAYELIDQGISTTDREKNWGLLRNDGSPKPQFTATKNLITLLSDQGASCSAGSLEYTLSGDLSSQVHHTLLQKCDGRFYLALWQEVSVWNTSSKSDISNADRAITLTLSRPASAINVYRPVSGVGKVASQAGTSISLRVPDEVLLVEIVP